MSDQHEAANSQENTEEKAASDILFDKSAENADEQKAESTEQKSEEVQETKPVEEKAGEADESKAEQETKEPEEFDLKLPENSLLSNDAVEELTAIAKENGLNAEQAQRLLDIQSETVAEFNDVLQKDFEDQVEAWGDEIRADKEYGGEKLGENAELAKRAVKAFAGEEFLQELDDTGYGNHPRLFKMLVKIGREIEAGGLVLSNAQSNQPKSMAEAFYGPSGTDNN